ncbi:hypothetical protein PQR14_00290 [Paraburkholderia bryophila]|uniref:hypothetical protein n=1 Tax=Burkholderiaceae TaxID=119060 RepID=UPI0007C800D5|nr:MULTISPECIES: hypothetical protein [Burkholderiaceae]
MTLDVQAFSVLDVAQFPTVIVRNEAIRPGYAAQWEREMEALIAHAVPFVMFHIEVRDHETNDDFKQRGVWLKQNKAALARVCRMLVTVESDDTKRETARIQGRGATRAFGIPHRAVATLAEAWDIASYRAKEAAQVEGER